MSGHAAVNDPQEERFVEIINEFRHNLNLQKLTPESRLQEAAEGHSMFMAKYHVCTHVGPRPWWGSYDRMYAVGIPRGTHTGEVVASGSYTAENTFIQWFFSEDHLQGMLTTDYDHLGVSRFGCESEEDQNRCYWAVDFSALNDESREIQNQKQDQDQRQTDVPFTRLQIWNAAEAVVGPLDLDKKEAFLNPPEVVEVPTLRGRFKKWISARRQSE